MSVVNDVKQGFKNLLDMEVEDIEAEDGSTYFRIPQNLKNGPTVDILIIIGDDKKDVAYRIFSLVEIEDTYKEDELNRLVANLNAEYRFVKFLVSHEDLSVKVAMDHCISPNDVVGETIVANCVKLFLIAQEAYPKLMKLVWK